MKEYKVNFPCPSGHIRGSIYLFPDNSATHFCHECKRAYVVNVIEVTELTCDGDWSTYTDDESDMNRAWFPEKIGDKVSLGFYDEGKKLSTDNMMILKEVD